MCKLKLKVYKSLVDGTPYEGKLSRTVWSGGKLRDKLKELPITIAKKTILNSSLDVVINLGYNFFAFHKNKRLRKLKVVLGA